MKLPLPCGPTCRAPTNLARAPRRPYRVRLELEPLEDRCAPAANLRLNRIALVDARNVEITAPPVGQMVFVRAEWTTSDLTPSDSYVVRFRVDGVPLDSPAIPGQFGQGLSFLWYLGGWYASPGSHNVQVTVDGDDAIAEEDESDNTRTLNFTPVAPATLPAKFVEPHGGTPFQDWAIVNYVDVNPLPGAAADYLGGPYQYDGHTGRDSGPANFARMDAGLPIYAAAAGVVTRVEDGHFDRETSFNPNPPNWVLIDHGNGWATFYAHFAANTITVKVGDTVAAGQLLGLTGSSGSSTGAHLHFQVMHDGTIVEPHYDPAAYWLNPLPYQASTPRRVLDYGITNYSPFGDINERPSDINTFSSTYAGDVWFWYRISHLNPGDTFTINWYRPSGVLDASFPNTAPGPIRFGGHGWFIRRTWGSFPGTWQVALVVNGAELVRAPFHITALPGMPEIRVNTTGTYILDERTTPIDFGSAPLGGAGPQRTFAIDNHGFAPLTVSNLVLPPGFSLVGSFPSTILPGTGAGFTLRLDTSRAGAKFGQVRFTTNDADEAVFNFNVSGTVTGAAPTGAPVVTLPDPALAYLFLQVPRVIDTQATLTDSNSAHFNSGSLRVEFAAGGTADDRLAIRNQGTGPGQIGASGGTVTFGGTPIGTFTGGAGTTPLVVTLNSAATPLAVQALLRNVTYSNVSAIPGTAPRYVRFTVVDETGLESNQPIAVVVLAPNPRLAAALEPTGTGFTIQLNRAIETVGLNLYDTQTAGLGPTDVTLTDAGGNPVRGSLMIDSSRTRLTFLRTGGVLPYGAYTVTLRSAANAFRAAGTGELLDGDGDLVPGGNYVTSFTVDTPPTTLVVVSVPDIVRGPGQTVHVPADSGVGLPLRLSDGNGITSIELTLRYDPALLTITDVTRGPRVPDGAVLTVNNTPGALSVSLSTTALMPLPDGPFDLMRLTAQVPTNTFNRYTAKHVLDITGLRVNGGARPAQDDDGLHVVGYMGDATANGLYGSADALRMLRVGVGLDGGFLGYPLTDPAVVADITGNGLLTGADATRLLQEAVGLDRPEIPPLPSGLSVLPTGPDPLLEFPKGVEGRPGDTITVPLRLDPSDGLESADLAISYDGERLEALEVRRGSLTADFDLFAVHTDPQSATIRVG
ncbi:MAG TPA: peptidoglycan DD-metalloendopeptidase family protein, partial [Gemmataceae bacterium]|nr:peptidoglycan DD-metalloendopeptidase family protein [Gemmataceae bacterium]